MSERFSSCGIVQAIFPFSGSVIRSTSTDHAPAASAEVKNEWSYTSIPLFAFIACIRATLPPPPPTMHRPATARLLGSRVLIPQSSWRFVLFVLFCVGRGLCDVPITNLEDSYRLWVSLYAIKCNNDPLTHTMG
jgi:hypothetical protein